jgi:hypothetical protein
MSNFDISVVVGDSAISSAADVATGIRLFMRHRNGVTTSVNMAGWVPGTSELVETTSSRRYKTNIITLEDVGTKFDQLRPVRYEGVDVPGKPQIGFIAEEVDRVFPEVVTKSASGEVFGLMYDRIVPMTVSEIQKLKTTVAAQSETIAAQSERISRLETLIAQLIPT